VKIVGYFQKKKINFFSYVSTYGAGFHYQKITEQRFLHHSDSKARENKRTKKKVPRSLTAARICY
jgi:hypothetical protein